MRALWLSLVIVFAGCASALYQADPAAPRFLSVSSSGGPGPSGESYFADGRFLVRESSDIGPDGHIRRTQTKFKLTPAQWSEFWRAADGLAIQRWKPQYTSAGLTGTVTDSPGWSVDFRNGSKSYHSEGDLAGPEAGHPERRVLSPTAVNELFHVFERFAKS